MVSRLGTNSVVLCINLRVLVNSIIAEILRASVFLWRGLHRYLQIPKRSSVMDILNSGTSVPSIARFLTLAVREVKDLIWEKDISALV